MNFSVNITITAEQNDMEDITVNQRQFHLTLIFTIYRIFQCNTLDFGNFQVPLHLEPMQQNEVCDKRLWIGNLDTRVNEYV